MKIDVEKILLEQNITKTELAELIGYKHYHSLQDVVSGKYNAGLSVKILLKGLEMKIITVKQLRAIISLLGK